MPALTIVAQPEGFSLRYYAPWQWAPWQGTPAQYYGEPYPSPTWILNQAVELYEYRRAGMWKQADAVRQWLRDYDMQVELTREGVTVKW